LSRSGDRSALPDLLGWLAPGQTKVDDNGTEISCGLWATDDRARAGIGWARAFIGEVQPAQLARVA
jgi:hypothetical protein